MIQPGTIEAAKLNARRLLHKLWFDSLSPDDQKGELQRRAIAERWMKDALAREMMGPKVVRDFESYVDNGYPTDRINVNRPQRKAP